MEDTANALDRLTLGASTEADDDPQLVVATGFDRMTPAEVEDAQERALQAATEATLRSIGGEGLAPEALAEAQEKAKEMLRGMRGDECDLANLRNFNYSLALPAIRLLFRHMIKAAHIRGGPKAEAIAAIRDLSPVTEIGCLKIDFFNRTKGAADAMYLLLGECPRGHNFDAQLAKLRPHVTAEKWPEIQHHMSVLVYNCRQIYAKFAADNQPLIRKIFGLPPDDACSPYLTLHVDVANTTLYLDESWPNRIGIFIRDEESRPD